MVRTDWESWKARQYVEGHELRRRLGAVLREGELTALDAGPAQAAYAEALRRGLLTRQEYDAAERARGATWHYVGE